jgi:hypothetical protein
MDYTSPINGLTWDVPEGKEEADLPTAFQRFADSISVAGIQSALEVKVHKVEDFVDIGASSITNGPYEPLEDWEYKLNVIHAGVPSETDKTLRINIQKSLNDFDLGWHFSFICLERDFNILVSSGAGGIAMTTSNSYNPRGGPMVAPFKMATIMVVPCYGNWCAGYDKMFLVHTAGAYDGAIPQMTEEARDNVFNVNSINATGDRGNWEEATLTKPEDLL